MKDILPIRQMNYRRSGQKNYGGYVGHTTVSGKMMASFKTTQKMSRI